jgi:hypothetical protein
VRQPDSDGSCRQALYERGETTAIRHGYQFINRRLTQER